MPFAAVHPAYAPYARWLGELPHGAMPPLDRLEAWAREGALALPDGRPLRFEPCGTGLPALAYERRIAEVGAIGVRPGVAHDAWNALAWLAFPRVKAALNAVHVRDGVAPTGNARSRARDAATLVDESGLIVLCADAALAGLLRAHAWRELFVARRAEVRERFAVLAIGHGLLESLARPYRALTAHALVLTAQLAPHERESAAAAAILAPDFGPARLTPLPVAALPGWDTEALGAALFDDRTVFRPPRARLAAGEEGCA